MRYVLVGDNFPAAQVTDALVNCKGAEIALIFTDLSVPSSGMMQQRARQHGVPVHDTTVLRSDTGLRLLQEARCHWLVNVNSTIILPPAVLESARSGAINMHPGLLPEYAGLHVHQWAIMNGETESGATVHYMSSKVDTGDIIRQPRVPVESSDTGLSLFMKCVRAGTEAVVDVVSEIESGLAPAGTPQDLSRRKLYRNRDVPDGRIDWSKGATEIERFVRAGNYEPFASPTFTAFLVMADGREAEVLKVEVDAGDGKALEPGTVSEHSGEKPVSVVAGDGNRVRIVSARLKGKTAKLPDTDLRGILLPGSVLS